VVPSPRRTSTVAQTLEQEIVKAREGELEGTRKTAEAWRNGLAGLIAVVTGFGLIKGKESIDDFDDTWKILIAVVFILAVAFAAIAAWYGLSAANGQPKRRSVDELLAAGGLPVLKSQLAADAVEDLKNAQKASAVAMILFVAGIGFTWFGTEAPDPTPPKIRVTAAAGTPLCGTSQGVHAGRLRVKTKGGNDQEVALADVRAIEVDADCSK
jgi:hypothetical protein